MNPKIGHALQKFRSRLAERISPTGFSGGAENVVWVFGTIRTGSTWLGSMMGDMARHELWNEPRVGELFGSYFYDRAEHRKENENFIMSLRYKEAWLRSIRGFVLDSVDARYPGLTDEDYVVIKEPSGSMGAPLLAEAFPESRVILLVRDPRDMVSSALDAAREGSWVHQLQGTRRRKRAGGGQGPSRLARRVRRNPDGYVENRANLYLRDVSRSLEAYEAHRGPKSLVRYEDLRADTLEAMKLLYSDLEIPFVEKDLLRVVEARSWERIPEEERGPGKFTRKAEPGGWQEDLTEEQAATVERITAPLLEQFYPS